MFSAALLKGARLGYMMNDSLALEVIAVGKRAHGYLTDTFVTQNETGLLDYDGTVSVCSLNSTASYEVSRQFASTITYPTLARSNLEYSTTSASPYYLIVSLELLLTFLRRWRWRGLVRGHRLNNNDRSGMVLSE